MAIGSDGDHRGSRRVETIWPNGPARRRRANLESPAGRRRPGAASRIVRSRFSGEDVGKDRTDVAGSSILVAPGSVVIVRDEEWLVTSSETSDGVTLLSVEGLSDWSAAPARRFTTRWTRSRSTTRPPRSWWRTTPPATGGPGSGSRRRPARPRPAERPRLTVSTQALATPLAYQQAAVRQALDPDNLRPADPAGRRGRAGQDAGDRHDPGRAGAPRPG